MPSFSSNTIQAHIAAFDSNSQQFKYLILKRSENLDIYPGLWQVVTGTIDNEETAKTTAIREIYEETGIICSKMYTLPYVASFFNTEKDTLSFAPVFGIIADSFEIVLSSEHSEFLWTDFDNCCNILPLPSHIEGTKIFKNYILDSKIKDLFKIKL
jgi:8-oxo-dGTP pyrophosphatase MutT (NUDIX family)